MTTLQNTQYIHIHVHVYFKKANILQNHNVPAAITKQFLLRSENFSTMTYDADNYAALVNYLTW